MSQGPVQNLRKPVQNNYRVLLCSSWWIVVPECTFEPLVVTDLRVVVVVFVVAEHLVEASI